MPIPPPQQDACFSSCAGSQGSNEGQPGTLHPSQAGLSLDKSGEAFVQNCRREQSALSFCLSVCCLSLCVSPPTPGTGCQEVA